MNADPHKILPGSLRSNLNIFFDLLEQGQISKEAYLTFKRKIYRQCEAAENIVDQTVMHNDTYSEIIAIMGDEDMMQPVGEAHKNSRPLPKLGDNVFSFPVMPRGKAQPLSSPKSSV